MFVNHCMLIILLFTLSVVRHLIFLSILLGFTQCKATTRHGVTRKKSIKRLNHIGNLFRKNLQLKDVLILDLKPLRS